MCTENAFLYSKNKFFEDKNAEILILKNEFRMILKVPQQHNNHLSMENKLQI